MEEKWDSALREIVTGLYQVRRLVEKEAPKCREASVTLTKIDEAAMWAKSIPLDMDSE